MSSISGGLRPPFQQPGLPAELGDQALDRFSEPAGGIVEGEFIPPFYSPPPERERGRIASLKGGRAPDRDHEHRLVIHLQRSVTPLIFAIFRSGLCVFFKKFPFKVSYRANDYLILPEIVL
jgi:hypothetical protein